VQLTLAGAAAPRVRDVTGTPTTQVTLDDGFVALGLTGALPSVAVPAELLVVASAPGYLETSQRVTLTAPSTDPAIIRMVSLASPPPGTAVGTSGAAHAGAGGVLVATVTVPTTPDAVTGGRASVTLPAGSVVRDATGTPLSGALQTTVVYFNNRNDESLTAFPGGFDGPVDNPPTGSPPEGGFFSAGYTAITVRDGAGRQARTFSTPVQVAVDVPAGTVDPHTSVPVKNGSVVPYWSYEPRTGVWRHEGPATLAGPDAGGNFTATMAMNHLSYVNLDWFLPTPCPAGRIEIIGNPEGRALLITLSTNGRSRTLNVSDNFIDLLNVPPRGFVTTLEAVDVSAGKIVGTLEISNYCVVNTLRVNLPSRLRPRPVTVGIQCGSLLVRPWGWFAIRKNGTRVWLWGGFLKDGGGELRGLEANTTYEVKASGIFARMVFSNTRVITTGAGGSFTPLVIRYTIDPRFCYFHHQGSGLRLPDGGSR
jgi:hypothetical protein